MNQKGNYQVHSIQGVLLKNYVQVQTIDIADLSKGTYIISLENGIKQYLIRF